MHCWESMAESSIRRRLGCSSRCSHRTFPRRRCLARHGKKIVSGNRNAKNWGWQTVQRNPGVYVRGRIRHPDHATITLHGWHQVVMNTENESRAMRNVAFLD